MFDCLVVFYEKEDGSFPGEEFINSLDNRMSAKAYRLIGLLANNGPNLREPYSRHLSDGIFELRSRVGSDTARILYFFMADNRAVITNGFVKKDQKTPHSEIEKAKKYRRAFLNGEASSNENI